MFCQKFNGSLSYIHFSQSTVVATSESPFGIITPNMCYRQPKIKKQNFNLGDVYNLYSIYSRHGSALLVKVVHEHTIQLGGYIHASTNNTHSLANLQDSFHTLASLCSL